MGKENEDVWKKFTGRLSRDEYYLQMLDLVALRSTCSRRCVGAIIVDSKGRVLSTGYNGVPVGFVHCIDEPCRGACDDPGDSSRCLAVHAEINAMLQCPRINDAYTIYVSCTPCFSCAKMICNTSIKRIVTIEKYSDQEGAIILSEADIEVVVHE